MFDYRQFLIHLPRPAKTAVMLVIDGISLTAAYVLLVMLRYSISVRDLQIDVLLGFVSVLGTLLLLLLFGFYRWQVRFISLRVLRELLLALVGGALLLFVVSILVEGKLSPLAAIAFVALGLSGLLGIRAIAQAFLGNDQLGGEAVIIYGAGNAGRQLAQALFQSGDRRPVAFIDDNPQVQNTIVLGLSVHAFDEIDALFAKYQQPDNRVTLCVAMPQLDMDAKQHLLRKLEQMPIHIQILNRQLSDQLSHIDISQYVQDLSIENLLGRDAIAPNPALMSQQIHQKTVLVSGAGGSIGSELVRQIIAYAPRKIILLDHSEFALYQIDQEVSQQQPQLARQTYLASVLDRELLEHLFAQEQINTVFHAAAYKHVSLVEDNIITGINNNVFGTHHLAHVARQYGVNNFVLISTDKAVRPTGIMGASKRLAELVVQAIAQDITNETTPHTVFSMVRFGNVLGSSGSVVPIFQRQIAAGGPVTVTDKRVTRYFMTIPEAAQLVIQSSSLATGGDVFLLDMGCPVVIADLAKRMVHLMGHRLRSESETGIEIVYTGLKAGEKITEELLIGGSQVSEPTMHPKIQRAVERAFSPADMSHVLDTLAQLMQARDIAAIYAYCIQLDIGFEPTAPIPST